MNMKPRHRIVASNIRLMRQLGKLMARVEKKVSPSQYKLVERQAVAVVDDLTALQERHIRLVDHLQALLGESTPPPPSSRPPSRRSSHPPVRHARILPLRPRGAKKT